MDWMTIFTGIIAFAAAFTIIDRIQGALHRLKRTVMKSPTAPIKKSQSLMAWIGNLCLLWIIGLLLKDYFLQGHDAVTVSDVVRISSLTCLTLVGLLIQALLFALNRLYR